MVQGEIPIPPKIQDLKILTDNKDQNLKKEISNKIIKQKIKILGNKIINKTVYSIKINKIHRSNNNYFRERYYKND